MSAEDFQAKASLHVHRIFMVIKCWLWHLAMDCLIVCLHCSACSLMFLLPCTAILHNKLCTLWEKRKKERKKQLSVGICSVILYLCQRSGDSLSVERRTRDRKVASSSPGRSGRKVSSPELTFCADSYSVSIPPCVTTVACKRPRSFCQMCRW